MFTRRKLLTALMATVLSVGVIAAEQDANLVEQADTLISNAFENTQRDLSLGVTFDVLEATQAMEVKQADKVFIVAENAERTEKAINPTNNNDA